MFTYQDIPNHFSFSDVYDMAVAYAPNPSVFVEVGTWLGSSTTYLAEKIRDSGKAIDVYAVDNFTGEGSQPHLLAQAAKLGGDFYPLFCENLVKCGVAGLVKPIKGDSTATAEKFKAASLDFVYLDACHERGKVRQDILAWLPKVKKNGILAGHDYDPAHLGVMRAVDEVLGKNFVKIMRHSWVYCKTQNIDGWWPSA